MIRTAWREAKNPMWKLLTCLLAAVAAASVTHGARNAMAPWGSMDLGISLRSAQVLQHEDPYRRYLIAPGRWSDHPTQGENPFSLQPVQAPSALMLLWPFSALPWPAAKIAWLAANLLCTAGLLMLAFRRFLPGRSPWIYVAIASLFVIGTPWRNALANGQHGIVGLFFFLAAMELADRRRSVAAGAALAGSLVKYSMILFLLPWFALKRQWLVLAVAAAIHGVMTIAICLWLGTTPWALVAGSIRVGGGDLLFSGFLDMFAWLHALGFPAWAPTLTGAVLLLLLLWIALARKAEKEDLFLAALCFSALSLVYHRAYDHLLLIVPLLVAIRHWRTEKLPAVLIAACTAQIWFLERAIHFLAPSLEGRASLPYNLLAALWYFTLATLLYRCMFPRHDLDGAVLAHAR